MASLTAIPTSFAAGDSLDVLLSLSSFPASSYGLQLGAASGNANFAITAANTGNGNSFSFAVNSATTNAWTPGTYRFQLYASNATTRTTAGAGILVVSPNLLIQQAESHARKALRLIQALIEGRATDGLESFTLDGQSIQNMPSEQLLKWEGIMLGRVAAEDAALAQAAGISGGRKILSRFVPTR